MNFQQRFKGKTSIMDKEGIEGIVKSKALPIQKDGFDNSSTNSMITMGSSRISQNPQINNQVIPTNATITNPPSERPAITKVFTNIRQSGEYQNKNGNQISGTSTAASINQVNRGNHEFEVAASYQNMQQQTQRQNKHFNMNGNSSSDSNNIHLTDNTPLNGNSPYHNYMILSNNNNNNSTQRLSQRLSSTGHNTLNFSSNNQINQIHSPTSGNKQYNQFSQNNSNINANSNQNNKYPDELNRSGNYINKFNSIHQQSGPILNESNNYVGLTHSNTHQTLLSNTYNFSNHNNNNNNPNLQASHKQLLQQSHLNNTNNDLGNLNGLNLTGSYKVPPGMNKILVPSDYELIAVPKAYRLSQTQALDPNQRNSQFNRSFDHLMSNNKNNFNNSEIHDKNYGSKQNISNKIQDQLYNNSNNKTGGGKGGGDAKRTLAQAGQRSSLLNSAKNVLEGSSQPKQSKKGDMFKQDLMEEKNRDIIHNFDRISEKRVSIKK